MQSRVTRSPIKVGFLCGSAVLSLAAFGALPALAETQPTGGRVVAGDAAIGGTRGGMLITQTSDRAVINWNGFSVGNDTSVNFDNGNGATLNRVTGDSISRIDGSLTATGSVFVLNSNGVVIGQNGVVDVGGSFVASTLNVSTDGFMRGGDQVFTGQSGEAVINFGRIGALGGDVALIGAQVENHGAIVAPDGTAALVAGYDVLMRDAALADGRFVVRLGGEDTGVLNTGRIEAASAELRANQGNVLALAGNTGGLIRAEGVSHQNGRIFLTAPGGSVQVEAPIRARNDDGSGGEVVLNAAEISLAGLVDVTGHNRQGGDITVEGDMITLAGTADLDASGSTGGLIRIGGDLQGGNQDGFGADMDTATDVTVDRGAAINADGLNGVGGNIVFWADRNMTFRGDISATGKGNGSGGFAEVSGSFLLYDGTADLRSASGAFGNLLLDPYNLTISTAPSSGNSGFTANGNNSNINVTTLTNALATASVTVSTGVVGSAGGQQGNLTVATGIAWNSGANLTLVAAQNININADITAPNGGLILNANAGITSAGGIDVGLFNLLSGDWDQFVEGNGGLESLPYFNADDFRITNGTFLRATGNCSEGCAYDFQDIYGVQGIAYDPDLFFEFLYLGSFIDATGTENWNGGAGFVPIGDSETPFGGTFTGNEHAILNLTINRPDQVGVGLFGFTEGAIIQDIGLVDANITGRGTVGALVGFADAYYFGEGQAYSTSIYDSWATGTVTAVNDRAGGLVGDASDLTVQNSWARVDVTARNVAGGLVGEFETTMNGFADSGIIDSYATGSVTATGDPGIAGGLVGQVFSVGVYYDSDIETSYASGAVSGTQVGGLVGNSEETVFVNSRWDMGTTGTEDMVGDGTWYGQNDTYGLTTDEARDTSNYSGFGVGFEDNWVGNNGMRPMLRSSFWEEINVAEQLQLLEWFPSEDAILMVDLDLTDVLADPAGIWGSLGFDPIGEIEGGEYSGFFDGNGHIIDGLLINRPERSYVGLFQIVYGGEIAALGLTNVDIRGFNNVGGLAGSVWDGVVSDVFVEGVVRGDSYAVGGVAGTFEGGSEDFATLSGVYADVTVRGTEEVGGVVGYAYNVNISNVYSLGAVNGQESVGGLIGVLSYGNLDQSFSVGRVTGNPDIAPAGGLIGLNIEGTATASFWDITASGQAEGVGLDEPGGIPMLFASIPGVTGLTTAQFQNTAGFMRLASSMGWDFTETWAPSAAGFYPALYALEPVIGIDAAPSVRLYGQSNAVIDFDGTVFGGPSSYLFGATDDRVVINASTLLAGVPQNAPVGQYAYGTSGLTSQEGVQYRVVNTGAGLTINPAVLTISAEDFTKIYGNVDPDFLFSVSGFVLGEGMSLITGEMGRAVGENVTAGGYALNLGTLSAGGNYTLVMSDPGSLFITQAVLNISTEDFFKIYGSADPDFLFSAFGFVPGDDLSLMTGELGRAAGENVTSSGYVLNLGTLSAGGNYRLVMSDPGSLIVNPAVLSISAEDFSKIYGDADPDFLFSVSGFVLGEGMSLITGEMGRAVGENVTAGGYALNLGTLSAGGNYTLVMSDPGSLFITQAVLNISTEDFFKIYGSADPDFLFSAFGFVPGDDLSLMTGELGRAAGENVTSSGYVLNLGTLSAGGNYRLVMSDPGSLIVNPAVLSISAEDFTKIYGNVDPDFLFSVSGFVLGEGMSLITGEMGRAVGENVTAGGYALNLGTLSAGGNYTLVLSGGSSLFITPRSLTISADDLEKMYGDPDAPLTWTIVDGMLVFNDSLTGGLVREPGEAAGIYAILQGSLTGGPNYNITFEPGTYTITPDPVQPPVEPPRNNERGATPDPDTGFDELISFDEPMAPLLPDGDGPGPLSFSTDTTDVIVQELEEATAYCSVIGQSEYVVDCLSERLAVIAASLPQTGDYAAARTAIDQAARQLSALVAENEDTDFPANLTRSLRPDAPQSSRPLRPVREATLEETLQQAASIVNETETVLLRSAAASSESVHFQRIATAVGSSTILLRSI